MGKPTYNRLIMTGDDLRDGIDRGMGIIYDVARAAYGVRSGNVMIENRADAPTISHDGVSNIAVLERSDPIEDMTIGVVKQASERTNKTAGDGTTLSAILSYHLYNQSKMLIEKGKSPMVVSDGIKAAVPAILAAIDKRTKRNLSDKSLRGVCVVSAGDESLGEMIYDVVSTVGEFGGVNVTFSGTSFISTDIVNGMYIDRGATATTFFNNTTDRKSVLEDVPVVILGHTITRQDEITPIIEKLHIAAHDKCVIFGNVMNDALDYLAKVPKHLLDVMVVAPRAAAFDNVLEDVALYTDGKVFRGVTTDWSLDDMGGAKSISVTERETTIVGGHGESSAALKTAVAELQEQREKADPDSRLGIETRIARLTAKVANIYVGGASDVEKKEVKLRIDDAVCAAKSALAGGVVAGGGVCLRDIGEELNLAYLVQPYRDLLRNAGVDNDEIKTKRAVGDGFDLKSLKIRNMIRANIVDPAIVIREAVINSHSVVAKLITTNMALTFEDRKWEF